MKYFKFYIFGLIAVSAMFFAFTVAQTGGIQGKITPVEGIQEVQLISGRDTLRVPAPTGSLAANNIKTGTYKLVVKAVLPYKDFTIPEVPVIDGSVTDVGQIKLLQEQVGQPE